MIVTINKEVFIAICLILPFIGFMLGYCTKRHREWRIENSGESLVRQILEEYCKSKDAHVLNCITIRLEDGSTTQIDHILVTAKGVFVIETKDFSGWIFGNPRSKVWTKIIYEFRYKFQNPIFQNYKHVKAIQNMFKFLDQRHIYNIVVFSGDSIFMTEKINNVCDIKELIPTIEKYSDNVLSLNHIQFCVGILEYMRLELTQKTDIEHQEYLRQKFGSR